MSTGRVIRENRTNYRLSSDAGELTAVVRGTFHVHGGFPKVGDWVEYTETGEEDAVIENVLPRASEIVRAVRERSRIDAQVTMEVLVANVDLVCAVMGLDGDFNLARLDRYVLLAEQSGIPAVILLTKADVNDADAALAAVRQRFPRVEAHAVSAVTGEGMAVLRDRIGEGITAVLLGSSGAGKSTITNWLLSQEVQETQAIREDDGRGRHTTTARQLFVLPTGGYLIDTPGMRELGLAGEAESDAFADIASLVRECRFADCDHERNPGCAVRVAIEAGELDERRFRSYLKTEREKAYAASRADQEAERLFEDRKKEKHKARLPVQQHNRDRRDGLLA